MKNLEPFFNPKSILIIGVSRREFTFNSTILKNLLEIFYRGNIYIVNPNAKEILGVKSYSSLEELPEIPELAVIVLGKKILEVFEKIAKFGIKYIAIETDVNIGLENHDFLNKIDNISKKYNTSYMGHSMSGIINYMNNFQTDSSR